MKKIIIYFIVLINSFYFEEVKAQSNFDFQDIIADTQFVSVKDKYNAILNLHPLIAEKKTIEAGAIKIRKSENRTGAFFIALLLLFLFAGIKNIFFRHFSNLFKVFTTFNISKRQMKEQLDNNTRASVLFLILYFCCVAFLLYKLMLQSNYLKISNSTFGNFILALGITIGFYILKIGSSKLLSWVFNKQSVYHEYQFTNSIVNEFAGLFLFPLSIFLLIANGKLFSIIFGLSILLLITMNIYKYVRLFGLVKKMLRMEFMHFFLYLCAFEIFPALILLKLIR